MGEKKYLNQYCRRKLLFYCRDESKARFISVQCGFPSCESNCQCLFTRLGLMNLVCLPWCVTLPRNPFRLSRSAMSMEIPSNLVCCSFKTAVKQRAVTAIDCGILYAATAEMNCSYTVLWLQSFFRQGNEGKERSRGSNTLDYWLGGRDGERTVPSGGWHRLFLMQTVMLYRVLTVGQKGLGGASATTETRNIELQPGNQLRRYE